MKWVRAELKRRKYKIKAGYQVRANALLSIYIYLSIYLSIYLYLQRTRVRLRTVRKYAGENTSGLTREFVVLVYNYPKLIMSFSVAMLILIVLVRGWVGDQYRGDIFGAPSLAARYLEKKTRRFFRFFSPPPVPVSPG